MSETQAIAAMALQSAVEPVVLSTASGREFLVYPSDRLMKDVSEPNAIETVLPDDIRQKVTLQSVESLVDYVNRFKAPTTVLFADIAGNSIVAVLDYHHAPDGDATAAPNHLGHAATMALPYSEEWATWTAIDGKLIDQLEFARFLEENAGDVVSPSGADLLEVCRDLQAVRKVDFRKAVRTSSDNESFEYTDETSASTKRGDVEVPSKFQLEIPVYFGEGATSIQAFLRWRLVEGEGLKLGIKLHRREHVRQAVFKQIVGRAADSTDCPALFGRAG